MMIDVENKDKAILKVKTLGGLQAEYSGHAFKVPGNSSSKHIQLFLILLCAGNFGVPRERLIGMLYPAGEVQDAMNAMRIIVFRLRKALSKTELPEGEYIEVENKIYRLGGPIQTEVDVLELKKLYEMESGETNSDRKIELLRLICNLYKGDFLPSLAGEEWVAVNSAQYQDIYFHSLRALCELLKKQEEYEEIYNVSKTAASMYPYEEWFLMQIDSLITMDRYQEAVQVYKKATNLLFEEFGLSPSEEMLEKFRIVSKQIHYAVGPLDDIKKNLMEKEKKAGAYYCSYPSFLDSYHIIVRTTERSGSSVFLLVCTITDKNGMPIEDKNKLSSLSDKLNLSIRNSLRRGDFYTKYSLSQFLILLMGARQEDCSVVSGRIDNRFAGQVRTVGVEIHYSISPVSAFDS